MVSAFLGAHHPVLAVAADRQDLAGLSAAHPGADLTVLAASVRSDADGARLAGLLRDLGRPIEAVAVPLCAEPGRGRLLDHPTERLRETLDRDLLPQLSLARHLLPLVAEANRAGSYVLVGGPGSEQAWAGYGYRSVTAAALRMLARVLHAEARALAVRVQMLVVDTPVCDEPRGPHDCTQWPSAAAVGRRVLELIERGKSNEAPRPIVHYSDPSRSEVFLS
jgi:NAD(P)-dependent dehydrogenase (short-subunit alcohol dehydrogenase family)